MFLKNVLLEFKKFISKGNVLDLAVGIIIGASFGKIVSSLVSDIIMPIVGMIVGKINFSHLYVALDLNSYATLEEAKKASAPILMYGNFIQSVIDFVIVGFAIFLVVKAANKMQKQEEKKEAAVPTTKECNKCFSVINIKATKCPFCCSEQ